MSSITLASPKRSRVLVKVASLTRRCLVVMVAGVSVLKRGSVSGMDYEAIEIVPPT